MQFAKKMGFHTVAVARGADKAPLAASLGVDRYIDSTAEDPAQALSAMGGARIVLGRRSVQTPKTRSPSACGWACDR